MRRQWDQGRDEADDMRNVRRHRSARAAGADTAWQLPAGDSVPGLRGDGAAVDAVRHMQRRRPRAEDEAPRGHGPRRYVSLFSTPGRLHCSSQSRFTNVNDTIALHAGVDTGSRLRVRGEGNAGRKGGPPGDLYVFITSRSHPRLRREGTTIHADVEISYVDAILGSTVQVNGPPFIHPNRTVHSCSALIGCALRAQHVLAGAGSHSGWAGRPEDPCWHAAGHHPPDGQARRSQAGSWKNQPRRPAG